MDAINHFKQAAAQQALTYVCDGMVLGLGTGSTNAYFLEALGAQVQSGALSRIRGVPTSDRTATRARQLGIDLVTLSEAPVLDLAVDGADEVDAQLNLIKGLGLALLREKMVEMHARQFVVVADETKVSTKLGTRSPLPVEIVRFEAETTVRWLGTLGCRAELWLGEDGNPRCSDNGNYMARCWFPNGIDDPLQLHRILADRPGVVEHGLFLGMATVAIIAGHDGLRLMRRP